MKSRRQNFGEPSCEMFHWLLHCQLRDCDGSCFIILLLLQSCGLFAPNLNPARPKIKAHLTHHSLWLFCQRDSSELGLPATACVLAKSRAMCKSKRRNIAIERQSPIIFPNMKNKSCRMTLRILFVIILAGLMALNSSARCV